MKVIEKMRVLLNFIVNNKIPFPVAHLFGTVLGLAIAHTDIHAITQYKKSPIPFTTSLSDLKTSIYLPVEDKKEQITIPVKNLKMRASKSKKDERVDPVQVYIPTSDEGIRAITGKLARQGQEKAAEMILRQKKAKFGKPNQKKISIDLSKEDLRYFDLKAISNFMARSHHKVHINTKLLNQYPAVRSKLLQQIKPFLSRNDRAKIVRKFKTNEKLSLEDHLLPRFARKMVKKFLIYRGPNCFHAALAFHDRDLTRSPAVNVKREPGYHEAMINYDELWRAINKHFYEVNPKKSALKYGDMLVFFAINQSSFNEPVNFRSIRHAATYLMGQYTFSKGSKSPNTPYTIKTLVEEWETWQRYTNKLGLRVYRRNSPSINEPAPSDLIDWIY
jgi:hypothetical protein